MKNYYISSVAAAFLAAATSSIANENNLTFTLEAGIEFDDNVSVSVLDQNTEQSDEAAVFDFSAAYQLIKDESSEIELGYDFYQSLYNDLDQFNLQIHTLSFTGSWVVDDLDPGLGYSFTKVRLDDDDLYDSHSLTPSVGFSGLESWYHQIGYTYMDKDFSVISDRDATQHSITADNYFLFMENKAHFSIGLRLEDEDAQLAEYDYQGTYLKFGVSMPVGAEDLKLKANYQHYWRDYDSITASIGEERDDEQDSLSLELSKPFYENLQAKIAYEYTNTDSNLSSADAEENIFRLSLSSGF